MINYTEIEKTDVYFAPPTLSEEGSLLDAKFFSPKIKDLLEEYNFETKIIPAKDILDKKSTPTSICMDLWSQGYALENEELNRVVLLKSVPKLLTPALSVSFCFLDSYRKFEEEKDIRLWKPLFEENGSERITNESLKFGRFMPSYLLLLNQVGCDVYVSALDSKRERLYRLFQERTVSKFPNPSLFHVVKDN